MTTFRINQIQPKFDNVLIQRLVPEQGIIERTDKNAQTNPLCKVLAVGPGDISERCKRLPVATEVGETVYVACWSGTDIENVVDENGEKMQNVSLVKEEVIMMHFGKLDG